MQIGFDRPVGMDAAEWEVIATEGGCFAFTAATAAWRDEEKADAFEAQCRATGVEASNRRPVDAVCGNHGDVILEVVEGDR